MRAVRRWSAHCKNAQSQRLPDVYIPGTPSDQRKLRCDAKLRTASGRGEIVAV